MLLEVMEQEEEEEEMGSQEKKGGGGSTRGKDGIKRKERTWLQSCNIGGFMLQHVCFCEFVCEENHDDFDQVEEGVSAHIIFCSFPF